MRSEIWRTLERPSSPSLFEARVVMAVWALIGLVFLVVGAYAVLSARPTPPDAELIASAR